MTHRRTRYAGLFRLARVACWLNLFESRMGPDWANNEHAAALSGIPKYVLELQACAEVHPQTGVAASARTADGGRNAAARLAAAAGRSECAPAHRLRFGVGRSC